MTIFKTIRGKFFLALVTVSFLPIVLHFFDSIRHNQALSKQPLLIVFWDQLIYQHGLLFLGTILFVLFMYYLSSYLMRRLSKMILIAQKASEGDFSEQIVVKSEDEVGRLESAISKMLLAFKKSQNNLTETIQKRSMELIESEKKHRELLNIFADVIYELDSKYRIVKAKHIESAFGYKESEVVGKNELELIHPDDHADFQKALSKAQKHTHRTIKDFKLRMLTKKGEIRYILLSCRFLYNKHKFLGIEGVLRDITPREELAQKVIAEKEKLEETYQNLHKSYLALGKINAQIAALAEINTTFSSNLNWKDKLHYIIESIKAFTQAQETLLFIQEEKNKTFTPINASVDLEYWEDVVIQKNCQILKEAIRFRKPLKYFEPTQCLDIKRFEAKGYHCMLVIPVIINNEVIGLFILFFANKDFLNEIQTKLTLAYTSQMAIALMMSGELDHSLKKIF